jgi:hypothetical protein
MTRGSRATGALDLSAALSDDVIDSGAWTNGRLPTLGRVWWPSAMERDSSRMGRPGVRVSKVSHRGLLLT